jgi:hypothetical protein
MLNPSRGLAVTDAISIDEAVAACRAAGNGMVPGVVPVQSELKQEASLIGLAYLNYIYQNDIANRHFCEAMLLMARRRPRPRRTLMSRCSGKRAPPRPWPRWPTCSSPSTTPSLAQTLQMRRSRPRSRRCGESSLEPRRAEPGAPLA